MTSQHEPEHSTELRHGVLGINDAIAQSLALLALALGVALAPSAAAATVGPAVPWAYIVAAVGSLCLASVIVRYTRRIAHAGSVYTYTSHGLGPESGFISGWMYAGAFALGISFVLAISAEFLSTVLTNETSINLKWFPIYMILLVALLALAVLDIRVSTRTQLVLAAVSAVAIIVLCLFILFKGGDDGVNLQPFNPSLIPSTHGLFLAVVLAFTAFIGFEASAVLGEETAEPRKAIPKAILGTVLIAAAFYIFVTWAMSLGFGVANADQWAKDPVALDTLATRYAGHWLAVIVDLSVAGSAFVAALGGIHLTSRVLFAMGRDRALPRVFAWTHPRFRSPVAGISFCVVLTFVLGVTLGRHYGVFTYFFLMATTGSLAILFSYILVAVAGGIYFWRERAGSSTAYSVLLDVVLPLGAIVICGYTIYKSVWPRPPAPISYSLWIAAGWLVAGIIVVAYLALTSPERVRAFGQAMDQGEGKSEVEVEPAPQPAS